MRTIIIFIICIFINLSSSAQQKIPSQRKVSSQQNLKSVQFDFHAISVAQVIDLIYGEALKTPYVIAPEILTDVRAVSFRYSIESGDLKIFMNDFLDSLGYAIVQKNGVDFISKIHEAEHLESEPENFIYQPKFREVSYLSRLLAPLFKGSFTVNRPIAAPEGGKIQKNVPEASAASLIDQNIDTLIFASTAKEIEKLKRLLPQVDFAVGQVVVRGVIYEVSTSSKEGSAFGLLLNLLKGKLNLGLGSTANIGNFLQLKTPNLDAIYSAIQGDSRFKVLLSSSVRITSGSQGSFTVGQDVPVLGAVSYPTGAGQAVQSVEYRSSGILFDILPTVRESIIDLNINQQLSNFITTTTGVNNSPTLTKRSLKTNVSMQDGDIIVLGGLTENKDGASNDGLSFLPKFLHTAGQESSKSEILLVLHVQKL